MDTPGLSPARRFVQGTVEVHVALLRPLLQQGLRLLVAQGLIGLTEWRQMWAHERCSVSWGKDEKHENRACFKCPNVSHHPTLGDIISNKYLMVMFKIPKKRTFTNPLKIWLKNEKHHNQEFGDPILIYHIYHYSNGFS